MPRLLPPFLAAVLSLHAALAAESPMVEVRAIFLYATGAQMKAALAAAGLPELPDPRITADQFAAIRAKLQAEGADFFSEPQTTTTSGLRSVISSVRELRYPTEFTVSKTGKWTPTGFETRNVGVEMEFEVVSRDDEINLVVAPTVTTFLGFIDYGSGKAPRTEALPLESLLKAPLSEGGCWQPVFLTFSVKTGLTLKSGDYALLGGMMKAESVPTIEGLPPLPAPKSEPEIFVFLTAKNVK